MTTDIPQSQKNIVRNVSRRAWMKFTVAESAKDCSIDQIARSVGTKFVKQSNQLSSELIDYWDRNKISEPASVFVAGEPGCEGWDE
jgi:hypothetical protein